MFREMRRKRQALSPEVCSAALEQGTSGVLALAGDDGYPYAVPLSYVYDGEKLYFHCAKAGHKLDAIRSCSKASFCVIDQDKVVPEEYNTYYRSVIAFGTIRILEDDGEKWSVMEKLAVKYAPMDTPEGRKIAIEREWNPLCVLEMTIAHMTGKQSLALMKPSTPSV
jgi:nitroimidazol reductase NimA-like FMN-containing flavoprotein (pyridoxamine 5'-phosphate oxidase superfamily)